jgi:Na+-translocating ferredoxin:NAD+ oxidoreductase RnfC subunit
MTQQITDAIGRAGVVGAGGAGFPTHVKLMTSAETIVANGAECEPLLCVDRLMMERYAHRVIEGLRIARQATGARRAVIYLKKKYHRAIEALSAQLDPAEGIELFTVRDYYPAGDEQQLLADVTGRVVPPGGIPPDIGAVVCNISTLLQVADAQEGIPVTSRFVTIAGEVPRPATVNVPIGTPVQVLLDHAGFSGSVSTHAVLLGGPLMGLLVDDWSAPVTKTVNGVVVLPRDHKLVKIKSAGIDRDLRMAASVCCQCNYCTLMCPRNSLGLKVEPHKLMRAVASGKAPAAGDPLTIFGCCDCGICTYYACNFGLAPGRLMTQVKNGMLQRGVKPPKSAPRPISDSREYNKLPMERLLARVGLTQYAHQEAPLEEAQLKVDRVYIPLRQHIGAPAQPCVAVNDKVGKGTLIARASGKISANVHAGIGGTVTTVTAGHIEIGG